MRKFRLLFLLSLLIGVAKGVWAETIDLSTVTTNVTAQNGDILTGTLTANVKISIADGATVILSHVTINGTNSDSYMWAGINCPGDATIILSGDNTVKGFYYSYPGIHIAENKTLTIQGNGSLTACSNGGGAGIGAGGFDGNPEHPFIPAGNIIIEGGTITATGGYGSAGIGGSRIGDCGTITIANTVTKVTATRGSYSPCSIGKGDMNGNNSGKVYLDGAYYPNGIQESPYTYATPQYVDLELPSGTLWATFNVGANSPEEYGSYFAFGEIEPKSSYWPTNYQWASDAHDASTLTT